MVRHFVHTKPAKSEEKHTKNKTPEGLEKRGVFESSTTIKRQKTFMSEQEPSECFIWPIYQQNEVIFVTPVLWVIWAQCLIV